MRVCVEVRMGENCVYSHFLTSSEELKELAFFKGTNWDDVLQRKVSVACKVCLGS